MYISDYEESYCSSDLYDGLDDCILCNALHPGEATDFEWTSSSSGVLTCQGSGVCATVSASNRIFWDWDGIGWSGNCLTCTSTNPPDTGTGGTGGSGPATDWKIDDVLQETE